MEMQEIFTAIQTIGFPILAYLLVFKKSSEQSDKWAEEICKMTKILTELSAAIKNQTQILIDLSKEVKNNAKISE